MILYSGYNLIKIISIFAFIIVFILTYKGIFILNEEVLVAICFLLFIALAVILLSDVIKASIFNRIIQIKNKFNELSPIIIKENNNFFITCYNFGDISTYDNTDSYEIINNFVKEFKDYIQNIYSNINIKNIYSIFNKYTVSLNNIIIYDLYVGLHIDIILFMYIIYIYIYYIPVLFITYIYNYILNKNNDVYLLLFNYIKYKEYRYSLTIYVFIMRELFLYYGNGYKIPKKYLNKIIKNK